MLELSNICHCVQHPWKLTSRDFWSSRNWRKPFSKQKCVFEKMLWWYLRTLWMLELSKPLLLYSAPLKLTSRDFWSSGNEERHLLSKNVFWKNAVGVYQKWRMLELSNLCHCVQHPWKLTSRDFWSSRNERKALSQQKHVFRKCSEYLRTLWMLELSNLFHCVQTPENLLVEFLEL